MRLYPLGCPVDLAAEQPFLEEAARALWPDRTGLVDMTPLPFSLKDAPTAVGPLQFHAGAEQFLFRAGPVKGRFQLHARRGDIEAGADSVTLLLESVVLTALTWTHLLPLHAGCVAWGGRSLLLCGDSHAGKSTLAYEFARKGWTYISDNSLYWAAPQELLISGSPMIKLRGRVSPVNPRDEGLKADRTAEPGPCVFLHRRAGKPVLCREDDSVALDYFLKYVTRPDREVAARSYRQLVRHGLWRIEYEEAADAVPVLQGLVCGN